MHLAQHRLPRKATHRTHRLPLSRAHRCANELSTIYYMWNPHPHTRAGRRPQLLSQQVVMRTPPQQWRSALPHMSFTTPFTGHGTRQGSHSSRSRPTS